MARFSLNVDERALVYDLRCKGWAWDKIHEKHFSDRIGRSTFTMMARAQLEAHGFKVPHLRKPWSKHDLSVRDQKLIVRLYEEGLKLAEIHRKHFKDKCCYYTFHKVVNRYLPDLTVDFDLEPEMAAYIYEARGLGKTWLEIYDERYKEGKLSYQQFLRRVKRALKEAGYDIGEAIDGTVASFTLYQFVKETDGGIHVKEPITLTRGDVPIAVVMSVEEYELLQWYKENAES